MKTSQDCETAPNHNFISHEVGHDVEYEVGHGISHEVGLGVGHLQSPDVGLCVRVIGLVMGSQVSLIMC